jgi:hypothetical protein
VQTYTQNMKYSLLSHGNKGYVNMIHCCIIRILPVLFLFWCNCAIQCSITSQKTSVVSMWEPQISQWLQFYNCGIYFICKLWSCMFVCMTSYGTTCGLANFTDMSALEIWILWNCLISPRLEIGPLIRYWPIQIKCLLRVLFCDTLCAVLILSTSQLEYAQHCNLLYRFISSLLSLTLQMYCHVFWFCYISL